MSTRKLGFNQEEGVASKVRFLYITSSRYERDWLSSKHHHSFVEIFYVRKGKGKMKVEEETLSLEANDIILINQKVQHCEISDSKDPLEYYVIGVDGLSVQSEISPYYCLNRDTNKKMIHIFDNVYQEMNLREEGYEEVCQKYIEILALKLYRKQQQLDYGFEEEHDARHECVKVKKYIETNYQRKITLDELAEISNLTKFYLSHIFKEAYAIAPISYLNQVRIEVCKDLLRTTNYSIEEIAAMTGFSSRSYLSQAFLKSCQITPQNYRKLNQ